MYSAIHAATQTFVPLVNLYLAPLRATWLMSIARMFLLLSASLGATLPVAQEIFTRLLAPFFDHHRADIERHLAELRGLFARLDEAVQEAASLLLKRAAVGGLSSIFAFPAATPFTAPQTRQPYASNFASASAPASSSAAPRATRAASSSALPSPSAPREFAPAGERGPTLSAHDLAIADGAVESFPRGRAFFAREPHHRAEQVATHLSATASLAEHLNGVVQPAVAEAPKPAYEDARAIRRRFRMLAEQRAMLKKAPP